MLYLLLLNLGCLRRISFWASRKHKIGGRSGIRLVRRCLGNGSCWLGFRATRQRYHRHSEGVGLPVSEHPTPFSVGTDTRSKVLLRLSRTSRNQVQRVTRTTSSFQLFQLGQFVRLDGCNPLDHQVDRIEWSSRLLGYPGLGQLRLYRVGYRLERYRIQRKYLYASVVSACPDDVSLFTNMTIRETYVKVEDGDIDIVQQLRVVFHWITARKEDNDLLFQILLQKCKQQHKPLVGITNDIALFEHIDRGCFLGGIDVDVQRSGAERDSGKIGDFGGLRSGEQHSLSVLCWLALLSWLISRHSPLGKILMICFISSSKPTSRIRSASSMTSALIFLKMNPLVFYISATFHLSFWWTDLEMIQ